MAFSAFYNLYTLMIKIRAEVCSYWVVYLAKLYTLIYRYLFPSVSQWEHVFLHQELQLNLFGSKAHLLQRMALFLGA